MEQKVQERIERAKELLKTAKHATMATVNVDGTPHNSPFYLILSKNLDRIYFGSHPDSLHSQNVERTGNMFVVIYDMIEKGGLYIKAVNDHKLTGSELKEGLAAHNATRTRDGKPPIDLAYYEGGSPQCMYAADIVGLWVNAAERDAAGNLLRDYRFEISTNDLLKGTN